MDRQMEQLNQNLQQRGYQLRYEPELHPNFPWAIYAPEDEAGAPSFQYKSLAAIESSLRAIMFDRL
jgi:hypothetical protein